MRRPLLAAASGILLSLSFPSAGLEFLIFVALVPLLVLIHEGTPGPREPAPASRAARWGPWITGIVFNTLTFWWIVRLPAKAMTHPWLIYPGLLALALYLGLYVALFGWVLRFARRRLGVPVLLLAPAAWVATEWAKSSGALGCPWANLGYALAPSPASIQAASLVGAPGLSVWIVTVNACVAAAVVTRGVARRAVWIAAAIALVWVPHQWGAARLTKATRLPLLRVALVQPNIASDEKWDPAKQDSVVATIYRLHREAATSDPRPDLIVWPETALPFYLRLEPAKLVRFVNVVREAGIPVLLGYPDARLSASGNPVTHNAAGLVLANGTFAAQYEKIHLVPFGERIPFQGLFPFLGKVDLGQAEWTPGTREVVFTAARGSFGVMICFESIFPEHARRYALEGAQYLVNITNDEWFGKTAGPVQHADMAILRSVELGMATVRCANTGISMLVDPYGRVESSTPLFEQAVLVGTVARPIEGTLFARWGDWTTAGSLALLAVLIVLAWFRPLERLDEASRSVRSLP
jgi:apolipoprotein N-acyltransferase